MDCGLPNITVEGIVRHNGDRTKTLADRPLPVVEQSTSRFSTLGGTTRGTKSRTVREHRQLDALWAGAGVRTKKGKASLNDKNLPPTNRHPWLLVKLERAGFPWGLSDG
jgi:hypothetical protein